MNLKMLEREASVPSAQRNDTKCFTNVNGVIYELISIYIPDIWAYNSWS
jgi:hypothetical protein